MKTRRATAAAHARRSVYFYGCAVRALAAHRGYAETAKGRRDLSDPSRYAEWRAIGRELRRICQGRAA